MGAFLNGQPPEVPYPPPDIPTPSIPAADFAAIGQQFAAGQKAAQKADTAPPWYLRWISWIVALVVGTLLNCWLYVVTKLLSLVLTQFNKSDASMNALASTALQGMLGVMDPNLKGAGAKSGKDQQDTAANLASIIAQGLEKGAPLNADGSVQPSNTGANNFLQMAAHMAIEGWLQGVVVEVSSAEYMERFADLKDTLENAFGMGRLARRALAAPMKILVEDPYTQLLNQRHHPTLLSPGELARAYLRDPSLKDYYYRQMELHGYSSDKAEVLISDQRKQLSPADVFKLMTTGYYSKDAAVSALETAGWDQLTAGDLLTAMNQEYTNGLNRKLVEEALSLLKANKIDYAYFSSQALNSGLPEQEIETYKSIGLMIDNSRTPRFTIAEGEQLVKKHIWTMEQFRLLMVHYGYSLQDQADLESLLFAEIATAEQAALDKAARQAAALARQQAAAARAAERARIAAMEVESKGVSTAQYETLVEDGLRTTTDYYNYLIRKQVAADNAAALTNELQLKLLRKAAAAATKAAAAGKAKAKNLDVTQLEAAVKDGLLPVADFTKRLEEIGMSSADAQLLTQELSHQMDAAATKAKATADAKAAAAVKHVDLSQMERAVLLGTQTLQQYSAFLDSKGFAPESRDVLVSDLQARLAAAQATAAKKADAAKKAATKGINLTQLERLVRAGIKTVADYQTALANLGYSADDQQAMVQYLQLQMEQDQQNLITHGHAADLVGQLGVSLTDLERAVKLGVVPIATYQDALARAGVSAADQQTMVQTLAAQIKTTRAQQTAAQSVSKQVAAAGVSLATLEKDTEAGRLSMEQFQALLAGYGVPESQITDVVQLEQDRIDNRNAVQALVADATAKAAAKGLDLAQDTAAYKQGVMTEEEWRSRVASLGYDAADVEILFETLAAAQAAAAAKSAKKTTTATTATAAAGTSTAPAG